MTGFCRRTKTPADNCVRWFQAYESVVGKSEKLEHFICKKSFSFDTLGNPKFSSNFAISNNNNMVITVNKGTSSQEIDRMLLSLKPRKQFRSEPFLGKIKWGEDGLEYQKRIRNEWD